MSAKHILTVAELVVVMAAGRAAPAAPLARTWEYETASNYIYNAELVEVADDQARLVLQAEKKEDAQFQAYSNALVTRNLSFDEAASIQLSGSPGSFSSNGVYTSRILDLEAGNQLQSITLAASIGQYIVEPLALAYYPMDNNWIDQVTGAAAQPLGNIGFATDAVIGSHSAYSFGNYEGRVTLPYNFLSGLSAFTLSIYIKADAYFSYSAAFGNYASGSSYFLLRQDAAAARSLQCIFTTTEGTVGTTYPLELNRWYHVVVTWDGEGVDDEARRARLYIDGTLVRTAVSRGGTLNYNGPLWIANDIAFAVRGWRGYLDELLFVRRALSFAEVQRLYEQQSEIFRPARLQVRSGPDIETLLLRSFVGSDATPGTIYSVGTTPFGFGPDFDAFDQYVQYRVELFTDRNRRQTPRVQAVRVLGVSNSAQDNTSADRARSTASTGTVLLPGNISSPFLGLEKEPNGGYYTNGTYISGLFDAGAAVQWFQLNWSTAPELSSATLNLLALWRVNGNWFDSKGTFSVSSPQNAAYTTYAKAGTGAGLFNGGNNFVTGFGNIGTGYALEFWVNSPSLNDEIIAITPTVGVGLQNRRIVVTGLPGTAYQLYVNGGQGVSALEAGWNHVVVVIPGGVSFNNLVVGRGTGGDYFEGKLDEIAVYSAPMTSAEATAHFVQGLRAAGGRTKLQVSDGTTTNFVGPNGNPSLYYTVPPFTADEGNLLGALPAQRYIRYKIVFEGEGDATPVVRSVKLTTALPNSQTFVENTAQALSRGDFVERSTRLYGGLMSLDDIRALGPLPFSAFSPLTMGIWHFDDSDWVTGERPVRAAKGAPGLAYGNAKPSFDARVGQKSGIFDGQGDYIDTIGTPVAIGAGDFSVSLWFKTAMTDGATIFSVNDATRYFAVRVGDPLLVSTTGSVVFAVHDGVAERTVLSRRGGYHDQRWHHVVGVRNGTQLLLYVDGAREGSLIVPGLASAANQLTYMIAKKPGAEIYFRGNVDELAIFGSAISEAIIGDHYAGRYRANVTGEYQSTVLERVEPSIWQFLAWVPMSPYSKPLTASAADTTLIGVWHFDESSGVVSNAVRANGLHGTVFGASYGAAGRFDRALDFTASEQAYVQIAHGGLLEPSPERLTVEAWVNARQVDDRTVLAKRDASNGYALYLDTFGRPVFWIGGTAVTGPVSVRAGKWTHLAGTYTGSRARLFVDGQLVATATVGGSLASGAPLTVGRNQSAASYFDGAIDEVAVHARNLNFEAILDHYKAGAVTLRLQARSSPTNATITTPFIGPDRTTNSYFLTSSLSDMTQSIDPGLFFQYRVLFGSEDFRYPPDLRGVSVFVSGYPISNPTIYPTEINGFDFLGHLLNFEHSRVNNPGTQVKYQLTGDSDADLHWYYYNAGDGRWTEQDGFGPDVYTFQANTIDETAANIDTFYNDVYNKTGGLFRFRAFLHSTGEEQAILDWTRLTASPGRIVITSPDGTENGDRSWLVSVPYNVTWTYTSNLTGTVTIDYSTDGGQVWRAFTPPATAVPIANGSHEWLTPATTSTQALVRIRHNTESSVVDQSDNTFTLAQGLQIAQHNGGDPTWYIGETNTIIWRRSFLAVPANLEFSATGSFTGEQVRINSAPFGAQPVNTYDWVTPMTNAGLISEAGYLRVIEPALRYSDISDQSFLMAGAVVTAPAPGQGVKKDAPYDLTWVSAGMGPEIMIEIQTIAGGPWEVIDPAAPNITWPTINHYEWTPTNNPTEEARLRLTSLTDPRARGLTLPFTIAAIELISPLGDPDLAESEIWLQGTTQTIAWVSGGAADLVNILYSTDGGQNYTAIATNYPNINGFGVSNVYPWIVVPIPSETVRVRIEDVEKPQELYDVSSYDFQIAGLHVIWPNGPYPPQYWDKGVLQNIQWDENAVGFQGHIDFSYDNGSTWRTIATGPLLGNRAQAYAPTNPTLKALVQIFADDSAPFTNVSDRSDAPFAVAGIQVARPNAASRFTIGTTNAVQYLIAATRDVDGHALIFYAGDGVNFDRNNPINSTDLFVDGALNTFNWVVEPTRRPSSSARLLIEAGPVSSPYSALSASFTLRGIAFDAPVAGTVWAPGLHDIRWAVAGIAADARADIKLSLEGGRPNTYTNVLFSDIFASVGSTPWTVPVGLGPSTNARLQIVVTSSTQEPLDIGYHAESAVFSLQGVRVDAPNAANRWNIGSTQTIRWNAAQGGSFVDIFYSSDGGATFSPQPIQTFVPSHNGDNSVSWKLQMSRTPSTNAVVRVVSRQYPLIVDNSEPFWARGIKITKPTGSDIYATTDATNLITWIGVNDIGPGVYDVFFTVDGGARQPVASGVVGPSINWDIPPAAISDHVRIVVTDGIHANTSSVFRVVDQPTISIASPQGGDYWDIGDTYTIVWNRGGQMPNDFSVWYWLAPYNVSNLITDGEGIIFDATNNAFRTTWAVPDNPTQAIITVRHNDPLRSSITDASGEFNLVGKYRLLNPPGPNDVYALNPATPIVWESRGSVPYVDFYYSLSDAHEPASWVKINAQPVVNVFSPFNPANPEGSWSRQSYSWRAVNARTEVAAVRVQEAAYHTLFDPNDDGPFADSGEFKIDYYTVYWDVYDVVTTQRLDHLSIVDSSGWALADAVSGISHDYPWGTYNTEIYREGFFDASILFWSAENTDISVPAPQSWTQHVAMVRSLATEAYHVLANFSYDEKTTNFTIHTWMERGGVILEDPETCTVTIYDVAGNEVDSVFGDQAQSNGVFWLNWNAGGYPLGTIFFAKVEIVYSGFAYSSGLTFTLIVPLSDEITAALDEVAAALQTNILGGVSSVLTNVADIISGLDDLKATTETGFTNLTSIARETTNMLGKVAQDVELLTNVVIDVIGPQLETLTNAVTTIGLPTLARILSRPGVVPLGSTNSLLYKSVSGYDASAVTLTITPASGGAPIETLELDELPVKGLYEGTYTADWGVNHYRLTVEDPRASDSFVLRVVAGDLYLLPSMLGGVSNQLDALEQVVIDISGAASIITNDLQPMLTLLTENLANLSTNINVDFDFIESAVAQLTNQLATLEGLEEIGYQVGLLTNSMQQILSITGVSDLVSELTNALVGVDWSDVTAIRYSMELLTNDLSVVDWTGLDGVQVGVASLTNRLLAANGTADQVEALTNALLKINFMWLTNAVRGITNTLVGFQPAQLQSLYNQLSPIDFRGIEFAVTSTTNILKQLSGLEEIAAQIGALSNSLTQISALTNIAPTINQLGAKLLPIDFEQMTNTLGALEGLDAIAQQIGALSNSLSQITDITNVVGTVERLGDALLTINFQEMSDNLNDVTNRLAALSGLDAIAAQIDGLSNSIAQISALTNLSGQVGDMWDELQTVELGNMASDLSRLTNDVAAIDWTEIADLQRQIFLLSNLTARVWWDTGWTTNYLTGLGFEVNTISTNLAALTDLQSVLLALPNLTNAIAELAGITNLGAQVSDLTNALVGLDWTDVLYIRSRIDEITNQVAVLENFDQLLGITDSIDDLTNSIAQLNDLTNMNAQVDGIAAAIANVDFGGLTNDVGRVLRTLDGFDWNVILGIQIEVQSITNQLAGLTALPDLIDQISGLTNSIGDLNAVTNLAGQIGEIQAAIEGVDFTEMFLNIQLATNQLANISLETMGEIQRDVQRVTNTLALARLDLLPGIQAGVNDVSNALKYVDFDLLFTIRSDTSWLTNEFSLLGNLGDVAGQLSDLTNALTILTNITTLAVEVDELTNALAGVDWRDIESLLFNMDNVTNGLDRMSVLLTLPDLLATLTNALEDITAVTNIGAAIGELSTNLLAINWQDVLDIRTEVEGITNTLAGLSDLSTIAPALFSLSNSLAAIQGVTNLGADLEGLTNLWAVNWQDVLDIRGDVQGISNTLAELSDLSAIAPALYSLSNSLAAIQGVTNLGADLEGLTNALAGLTNLSAVNWQDVLAIRGDVQGISNTLAELSDLSAIAPALYSLSNSLAAIQGVTNLGADLEGVTNMLAGLTNLSAVNWQDVLGIRLDVQSITNSLAELSDLSTIAPALYSLSNSLAAIQGVTNLGADLEGLTNSLAGLTNLSAVNWGDILSIRDNVGLLTNQLVALGALPDQLVALSNSVQELGALADVPGLLGDMSNLVSSTYQMTTNNAVLLRALTNSMAGVRGTVGSISNIVRANQRLLDVTTNFLFAISNYTDEAEAATGGSLVRELATVLGTVQSNFQYLVSISNETRMISDQLPTLVNYLVSISNETQVIAGDAVNISRSMATYAQVNQIRALMGTADDTASSRTFFGRMAALALHLSRVGVDAQNAAQRAQSAKSRAASAASSVQQLQSDLEEGDLLGALDTIRTLQRVIQEARDEIGLIPKDVDTSTVFQNVRRMANQINQFANSKGFPNLLDFEGPAGGEGEGGGFDVELAKSLNQQIQEVRAGMEFMQELVDEMRFEPVVHESLLGVE